MQEKQHYAALDGLRGVAALAVMVMHKGRWFYPPGGYLGHAWMAVDFFFLLSGFVIAAAYEARLEAGLPVLKFLRTRLIRLWPLIALGMLAGAAWPLLRLIRGDDAAPDGLSLAASLTRGLLLIPALKPDPVGWGLFPLNGPTWSLFFELAVNLVYVLVARRLTLPLLMAIVAVSAGVVAWLPFAEGLDAGASPGSFWWGLPRTSFGFFAGVLMWRLRGRWMSRFPAAPAWLLALTLTAVFVVPLGKSWTAGFELICVLALFPLLLALGATARPGERMARLCQVSGDLSYPIYALHYPLLVLTGGLLAGRLGAPWLGVVAYPLVLGLCWLAWRFYDLPARAWLNQIGRPAPQPATASV